MVVFYGRAGRLTARIGGFLQRLVERKPATEARQPVAARFAAPVAAAVEPAQAGSASSDVSPPEAGSPKSSPVQQGAENVDAQAASQRRQGAETTRNEMLASIAAANAASRKKAEERELRQARYRREAEEFGNQELGSAAEEKEDHRVPATAVSVRRRPDAPDALLAEVAEAEVARRSHAEVILAVGGDVFFTPPCWFCMENHE